MEAMETDVPFRIGGNVMNSGLITNLPAKACVEVACMVDRNGVQPCFVGDLPEQLAALNRTNINPQILTVEAALTLKKEHIYHAAMLDPHTSSELTIDEIHELCDDLIEAHGKMLPKYTETLVKPSRSSTTAPLNSVMPLYVIGPFDNRKDNGESLGLSQVLPPEEKVDLKALYTGKNGKQIGWSRVTANKMGIGGFVDLRSLLGNVEMAVGYAYAVIKSDADCNVKLQMGSDDGIAIFLNGAEVLRVEATRSAFPAQNTVMLSLKKGKNHLLMKVDQKLGDWGFYATFTDRKPAGVRVVA
jgi:hypothetical protein